MRKETIYNAQKLLKHRGFTAIFVIALSLFLNHCQSKLLSNLVSSAGSTYTVSGNVSGLSLGDQIILQNNGKDNVIVTGSGTGLVPFTFKTPMAQNETYLVTILTQPTLKNCVVGAGFGTIVNSNVQDIVVTCGATAYLVGGTVTGLSGAGLVLTNNATDFKTINANGAYTFPTALSAGASYSVAITAQPSSPNQSCTLSNAVGTIASNDVTNVNVTCVTVQYSVGGKVLGLAAAETITLQNNLGNNIVVTGAGTGTDLFAFSIPLNDLSSYSVSILTPPAGKNCSITNAAGTVSGALVSTVTVSCIPSGMFSVGGTLSGLATNATLIIKLATGENLILTANGNFTFATAQANLASYTVTVLQNPTFPGQTCLVTNGAGAIAAANVTNVGVACTTNSFTVSANITGLTAIAGTITIKNNGTGAQNISADGIYSFAPQLDATVYNVSITASSSNANCVIGSGTGVVTGANVMVNITCNPVSVYSVSAVVSGTNITGGGLILHLNGGAEISTPITTNTTYIFSTAFHLADHYSVTISQQPNRASGNGVNQTCSATNASGTIAGNVNVLIYCSTNTYTVSGVVNGLANGETTILSNNNTLVAAVTGNGSSNDGFVFTAQGDGSTFSIAALTAPAGKSCTVGGTPGTIAGANITTVVVTCNALTPYTVGGTVNGLIGSGLVLKNNGGNNLNINADGGFTFSAPLYGSNPYNVTIFTQPTLPNQVCSVTNASGNIAAANITNVMVNCVILAYQVTGTITGLQAGDMVTLTNNWNDYKSITSVGGTDNYFFNKVVYTGDFYNVMLNSSIPGNIQCTSGSGTVAAANIVVNLTCHKTYAVGGVINGLPTGYWVQLQNTYNDPVIGVGSQWINPWGNTGFPVNFLNTANLVTGATYTVSIVSASPGVLCAVNPATASGTIATADVTSVVVNCSFCGDLICNGAETYASCPSDCPSQVCPDGVCSGTETNISCPADCPAVPVCGDALCSGSETPISCAADCASHVPAITAGNITTMYGQDYTTFFPVSLPVLGNTQWISFNANGTSQYAIIWNDAFAGSGVYTANTWVAALSSVGVPYFGGTYGGVNGVQGGFSPPQIISPAAGTVYLETNANWAPGSAGINVLPYYTAPVDALYHAYSVPTYQASALVAFPVTMGTSYTVYWDDAYSGSATYSADVWVSAYQNAPNGISYFLTQDSGYSIAHSFIATATGTVYLEVNANWMAGTVGVKVSSP